MKIRYPVPEKEYDYWIGRYFYESSNLSGSERAAGFIDSKLVFY